MTKRIKQMIQELHRLRQIATRRSAKAQREALSGCGKKRFDQLERRYKNVVARRDQMRETLLSLGVSELAL